MRRRSENGEEREREDGRRGGTERGERCESAEEERERVTGEGAESEEGKSDGEERERVGESGGMERVERSEKEGCSDIFYIPSYTFI